MKKNIILPTIFSLFLFPNISYAIDFSEYFSTSSNDFKRFTVSVGVLHVTSQGDPQTINVGTIINEGENGFKSKVGDIKTETIRENLNTSKKNPIIGPALDLFDKLPGEITGNAYIRGLESWDNAGTGLKADDVTTLGILTNYYFTDNISLEVKAGIPPKVDLQGKGKIYAPFSATAKPLDDYLSLIDENKIGPTLKSLINTFRNISEIELENKIFVTDLEGGGPASTARAWTPAVELQYHFGKTGVNKFRPYLGAGVIYAYFNELELNSRIEKDLINAGHMIANIKLGKAANALEQKHSGTNPKVKLDATDVFAPVFTAGFTYDFNPSWFAVGSLSYSKLKNEVTITVSDDKLGKLIESKTKVEINPLIAYLGVGYRF